MVENVYWSAGEREAIQAHYERALEIVCSYYNIHRADIESRNRQGTVAEARQVLYLMLSRAGWSMVKIGAVCDRNHSTISSAMTLVHRRLRSEWELRSLVADAMREFRIIDNETALARLRAAASEIRAAAESAREYLEELETEADALIQKIAQAERVRA